MTYPSTVFATSYAFINQLLFPTSQNEKTKALYNYLEIKSNVKVKVKVKVKVIPVNVNVIPVNVNTSIDDCWQNSRMYRLIYCRMHVDDAPFCSEIKLLMSSECSETSVSLMMISQHSLSFSWRRTSTREWHNCKFISRREFSFCDFCCEDGE